MDLNKFMLGYDKLKSTIGGLVDEQNGELLKSLGQEAGKQGKKLRKSLRQETGKQGRKLLELLDQENDGGDTGFLDSLSQEDREQYGKVQKLSEKEKDEHKEAILKDLKENHLKVERNVEKMGYKGIKVYLELPAVGNFEGFKFEYFLSYGMVSKQDFEKNPNLEKQSYSMKEMCTLLSAMNRYMKALGVEVDNNVDYENTLKVWETKRYRSAAGDCLKSILDLDDWYWLKDKYRKMGDSFRVKWICHNSDFFGSACFFDRFNSDGVTTANLLLKLS